MAVGDVTSNKVGSGARFNDGKVRYDLIPTHLLESTANVLEYGAQKYAPWNWAKGMKYSVVIGCIKRHLAAIERGEDIDPETGQRHTGHLMCNLLFLEHYMNMYPEMDDRPREWFGAEAKAEGKEMNEQSKDDPATSSKDKYAVEQRGVPDVREDIQQANARAERFLYFADGVEYWRAGDGSVVRYNQPGSDSSG